MIKKISDYKICKSVLSKAKGLMFAKDHKKSYIFVFNKEKIISLHMFFVFFPIDVIWLDKNKKVVEIKENFKPFRICVNKKPSKYIVEAPQGFVSKEKIKIGDFLEW